MILPCNRLWGLWEMLELRIEKLIDAATYLQGFIELISDERMNKKINSEHRKIYLAACNRFDEHVEACELRASIRALSRLVGNLEESKEFTYAIFKEYVEDLLLRMKDELELTRCFVLETNKVQFYEPEKPLFGDLVASGYPSAYQEIEEAGKCLALGRATACVFHLMRTMEIGIRAVAKGLKIPDPTKSAERNWAFILRKVREAIEARQRWRRKADKAFYEEAAAHLDSVKNPWRNATMHVQKTYTEEEAENIFYIVRAFMMKIASRIDENGKFV